MLIFVLIRSFVGINSGDTPYPVLTFAALLPWIFPGIGFRRRQQCHRQCRVDQKDLFPQRSFSAYGDGDQVGRIEHQLFDSCRLDGLLQNHADSLRVLDTGHHFL